MTMNELIHGELDTAVVVAPEQPPPSYDASACTVFGSLCLPENGRIRLLQLSYTAIDAVRETIERVWRPGIQAEKAYNIAHEFKLRYTGRFSCCPPRGVVPSILLIKEILATLYSLGWILTTNPTITRTVAGRDTLLLRQQSIPPPEAYWVAISFKARNKIRFLGTSADLISAFCGLFTATHVLQSHTVKQDNYSEFILKGSPWNARGSDAIKSKTLILRMTEILDAKGWNVCASVDQNCVRESDVWYCMRPRGWTPSSISIRV